MSPRPADAVGLSPEQVVAAALHLVDRDGLTAFSVRSLARELGVNPTAITWHVGNRDRLLAAIVDLVLVDVGRMRLPDRWELRITQLARQFRKAVFEHPNVAPLLGNQLTPNTGSQVASVEVLLQALHDAGLRGQRLVATMNAVLGAVVGFVALELAHPPDDPSKDWEREVRDRTERLHPVEYPMITAHRARLANRSFVFRWSGGSDIPLDRAFDTLLETLIAGIRAAAPPGVAAHQNPPAALDQQRGRGPASP